MRASWQSRYGGCEGSFRVEVLTRSYPMQSIVGNISLILLSNFGTGLFFCFVFVYCCNDLELYLALSL